jgi:hypothetical protein
MWSRRVRWILIALLVVLAASEYHAQTAQIATLQQELGRLRDRQERLANQAARAPLVVRSEVIERPPTAIPAVDREGVASATAGPGERPAEDAAASARRWEAEAAANVASVEQAFTAEPTDAGWATATRGALVDHLNAVSRMSASALGAIDCRSSICRVEVVHHDAEGARQFAAKAFTDPSERAWNGPVVIATPELRADGSVAMVMYLGREGAELVKLQR